VRFVAMEEGELVRFPEDVVMGWIGSGSSPPVRVALSR
jgi:hypothetical protein